MSVISRQAAIDSLETVGYDFSDSDLSEVELEEITRAVGDIRQDMIARIKQLPPAESKRTGKWIPVDSYTAFGGDKVAWYSHGNPIAFYYCSECKKQAYADENGDSLLTNFCPNCGKPMKMEETV